MNHMWHFRTYESIHQITSKSVNFLVQEASFETDCSRTWLLCFLSARHEWVFLYQITLVQLRHFSQEVTYTKSDGPDVTFHEWSFLYKIIHFSAGFREWMSRLVRHTLASFIFSYIPIMYITIYNNEKAYVLKTSHVVALPFMYAVECIIISNQIFVSGFLQPSILYRINGIAWPILTLWHWHLTYIVWPWHLNLSYIFSCKTCCASRYLVPFVREGETDRQTHGVKTITPSEDVGCKNILKFVIGTVQYFVLICKLPKK